MLSNHPTPLLRWFAVALTGCTAAVAALLMHELYVRGKKLVKLAAFRSTFPEQALDPLVVKSQRPGSRSS